MQKEKEGGISSAELILRPDSQENKSRNHSNTQKGNNIPRPPNKNNNNTNYTGNY